MVLVLYTHELGKTAKKPTVMSISPWIGRQTVVVNAQGSNFVKNPSILHSSFLFLPSMSYKKCFSMQEIYDFPPKISIKNLCMDKKI